MDFRDRPSQALNELDKAIGHLGCILEIRFTTFDHLPLHHAVFFSREATVKSELLKSIEPLRQQIDISR